MKRPDIPIFKWFVFYPLFVFFSYACGINMMVVALIIAIIGCELYWYLYSLMLLNRNNGNNTNDN